MNKTKIEWCDSTWNPVTGCLHGCEYCYARKIANRFGEHKKETGVVELHWKRDNPYPYDFYPTLHKYRMDEPSKKTKGQNIFVCSMADLFGDWVHPDWIKQVFEVCNNAPQHNYLFLTKNPSKYDEVIRNNYKDFIINHMSNWWFGTTVNDENSFRDKGYELFESTGNCQKKRANRFLSIEPLLGEIEETSLENLQYIDWVIIGAETGNRKEKVIPWFTWINSIVKECKKFDIPVFMKESLVPLIGEENMLREFPEGLKR